MEALLAYALWLMFYEPPTKEEFKIINSVGVSESSSNLIGSHASTVKVRDDQPTTITNGYEHAATDDHAYLTQQEQELEQLMKDYNCGSYTACMNIKHGTTPFPYNQPEEQPNESYTNPSSNPEE